MDIVSQEFSIGNTCSARRTRKSPVYTPVKHLEPLRETILAKK
jgi:hypothetical protein